MSDETTFAQLAEQHRRELRVHCFRLLGTYDESEDLVQETLLRAWRGWPAFENRASFRTWLYRIATNTCRNEVAFRGQRPRVCAWQPATEPFAPDEAEPDVAACTKEATELAMLLIVRQLPARQRVVLILRDLLGWPAKETAEALGATVASANSSLQRARATLREHLTGGGAGVGGGLGGDGTSPSPRERELVRSHLAILERPDAAELARRLIAS